MATLDSLPPWQPLTFGGVASFARASFIRLLIVQCLVAALVGVSVSWCVNAAWFSVAWQAIARLPEKSAIRNGRLEWTTESPVTLAEGNFLSIIVDDSGNGRMGRSADVQLELRRSNLKIASLLGYATINYPRGWTVALNHSGAESWWGAWHPFLLVGVAAGVMLSLWVSWLALAAVYSVPARLITFYSDRESNWSGCWKLAGASLLPGALLMAGAIVLYGLHRLDLVGLLFAWLLHFVSGLIYLGIAVTRLPRIRGAGQGRRNPFSSGKKTGNPTNEIS